MADPLTFLRMYNISKDEIIIKDNHIMFGDVSWPKTVHTNFLMFGSGKDGTPKMYYTLECLLYLLKNVTLPHPVYVRQAAAENIPVVRRPDRRELLAYLNGELSTSASIHRSARLKIPTRVKRSAAEDFQESVAKKPRMEHTLQVQRVKQRLAVCLDALKESAAFVDIIKSLQISEAMAVEKIVAIIAKRLAKKLKTNKGHDGPDPSVRWDFDFYTTEGIIEKDREWRTRTTTLQSNGKEFAKNIFAILNSIKNREDERSLPTHSMSATPRVAPTKPTIPQSTVYNRYDQERFIKSREDTEGFKINTMGTYHGMTLKSVTEGSTPKKPVATVTSVQQSSMSGLHKFQFAELPSESSIDSHSASEEHEFVQPIRMKRNFKRSVVNDREEASSSAHLISEKKEWTPFGNFVADNIKKEKPVNQILAKRTLTNWFLDMQKQEMETLTNEELRSMPPQSTLTSDGTFESDNSCSLTNASFSQSSLISLENNQTFEGLKDFFKTFNTQ